MKRFLLLALLAASAYAQTAVYPNAIATDPTMIVAADNVGSFLSASMGMADTVMFVVSGTGFVPNSLATLGGPGGEQIEICGVSGNTLSIGHSTCPNIDGRGFAGTSAATHAGGVSVGMYNNAWPRNQDRLEIEALEGTLGANLGNLTWAGLHGTKQGNTNVPEMAGTNSGVAGAALCNDSASPANATTSGCAAALPGASGQLQYPRIAPNTGNNTTYQMVPLPTVNAADYIFAPQTCNSSLVCSAGASSGGTLAASSNSITVTPVPLGTNWNDLFHYVYVSGGTGTPEACHVTGGNATAGSFAGLLIINCAFAHSGAWTVQSGDAGMYEALNSSSSAVACVLPAGYSTVHGPTYIPSGYAVRGNSQSASTVTVAADFPLTALGVFTAPVNVGFGPQVSDLSIVFLEPDSLSIASYTQWPPAFYFVGAARFRIDNVTVYSAWDVVNMTGNAGGAMITNLQASMFDKGIIIDGALDSVYLERIRFWPYNLTPNQQAVFFTNPTTYGLYSGSVADLHVSNFFADAAVGINLYQSSLGSTTGTFSDIALDSTSQMTVSAGYVVMTNYTQSFVNVGAFTGLAVSGAGQTTLQLTNAQFYPGNCAGAAPYITVSGSNNTLQLSNSWFWSQACDMTSISESGSGNNVIVSGNWFNRFANTNYANPTVSVTGGRMTFANNRTLDKGSGTGKLIAIANDDFHQIRGNSYVGWGWSFPAIVPPNASNGVYETDFTLGTRSLPLADFSGLTVPAGSFVYCNNCQAVSPCVIGGTGAMATSTGLVWNCAG